MARKCSLGGEIPRDAYLGAYEHGSIICMIHGHVFIIIDFENTIGIL